MSSYYPIKFAPKGDYSCLVGLAAFKETYTRRANSRPLSYTANKKEMENRGRACVQYF